MSAIVDPDFFRPDPDRAIIVKGTIDEELVSELTLPILRLQAQPQSPITVIIDSRGGSVAAMEQLERLLRAKDIDGNGPCAIITVVTGRAMSAAADLLSAGDYAYAYPGSAIHCHGVRQPLDLPVTAETASFMAEWLRAGNDRYAFMLAQRCAQRFMLRFVSLRRDFDTIRKEAESEHGLEGDESNDQLDDLTCFVVALARRVSAKTSALTRGFMPEILIRIA